MPAYLAQAFNTQFFDGQTVAAGYALYTYESGTATPKTVYKNQAGTVAHTNPIVLDADGYPPGGTIWIASGECTFVLKDTSGGTVWTRDDVAGSSSSGDVATLRADIASTTGARMVGYKGRTVFDRLGDETSIMDHYEVSDGADYYPAFTRAHDALPPEGGRIIFPATANNIFDFSQTLDVRKMLHIVGQISQSGTTYVHGTRFRFPPGVTGIIFNSYNTSLNTTVEPNQAIYPGAYKSVLEKVQLQGGGGDTADGVVMRCGITLKDVSCIGFSRHGVRIDATLGGSASEEGDANGWAIENGIMVSNGGHGLYVNGNDANVGVATKLACRNNGGWGVYDNSLIGNTYVGLDTASNTLGPMWSDRSSARVTLVGAWEDGGGQSVLGGSVTSVGGNGLNPSSSSLCFHVEGGLAQRAPFKHYNQKGSVNVGSQLGINDSEMGVFAFGATTESPTNDAWKLKFDPTYQVWYMQFAGSASFQPIAYPNSVCGLWLLKKLTGPVFQNGYAVKNSGAAYTSAKVRLLDSTAPTSGTYEIGDIVYNSAPTAGGFIGWVCTTGGTPGTWKTFGAISA